jgi:hypothetical protein
MKPRGSIRVVRKWSGKRVDPDFKYFDSLEGLNNGHLPSGRGPRIHEITNGLRLGTIVPSQDLSGAWVTVQG